MPADILGSEVLTPPPMAPAAFRLVEAEKGMEGKDFFASLLDGDEHQPRLAAPPQSAVVGRRLQKKDGDRLLGQDRGLGANPFHVLATQNPVIEQAGTYPLPEAQA